MTSGGKLEVATHKLGSIHIEDKLKEETPWWAKLKKKHGGTATKDKEGSTEEPVYSTFGWVEDEDMSFTTLRTFVDVTTLPTVKATPSTTQSTTSTTENTTKGDFFLSHTLGCIYLPLSSFTGVFKTTTRPVALSWLQWLAAKSEKNKKKKTTTTIPTPTTPPPPPPTTTSTSTTTVTTTLRTTTVSSTTGSSESPMSTDAPIEIQTVQYIPYRAPPTVQSKPYRAPTNNVTPQKLVPFKAPPGFEYPGMLKCSLTICMMKILRSSD